MANDFVKIPFSQETRANLRAVFDDAFMQANTNCADFDAFMFSSAVFVNWDDDLLVYSKSRFDTFVSEATRFEDWDEMLRAGAADYEKKEK
ncbi:MAG: hypothetical protein LBN12_01645 [Clostridiales Family XIII bacterium]|nr:hypothetical protein [Clostridiales Family XIII bacterium]